MPKHFSLPHLALLFGLGFLVWQTQSTPPKVQMSELFSESSLAELQRVNYSYDLVAYDLSEGKDSTVISDLTKANVLLEGKADMEATGFLAKLNADVTGQDAVLLFQPQKELDAEEWLEVQMSYAQLPEFDVVEADQDLILFSEPVIQDASELKERLQFLIPEEPLAVDLAEPKSVHVGIIDSGIDPSHPFFEGHEFVHFFDATGSDFPTDEIGHGTHVTGILLSHAPKSVRTSHYRIYNSQGGKLSNVIMAFEEALNDDVDVINASFGILQDSELLEELIERSYEEGVVVVAAAGNQNSDQPFYPATYKHSIAVGSTDQSALEKLKNSNYGDWVDLAALGFQVRSTLPGETWGFKTGTSQASPFVAAAAARLLTDNELSFEEVLEELRSTASKTIQQGELAGVPVIE